MFLQIFFLPLSLFLLVRFLKMHILVYLIGPTGCRLCFLSFFFCPSNWLISNVLSSSSLIIFFYLLKPAVKSCEWVFLFSCRTFQIQNFCLIFFNNSCFLLIISFCSNIIFIIFFSSRLNTFDQQFQCLGSVRNGLCYFLWVGHIFLFLCMFCNFLDNWTFWLLLLLLFSH